MKQTLTDYQDIIMKLPLKTKYEKEELLIEDLLIAQYHDLELYYAPHNEYINATPKVFIIGITPGFSQMNTAIATAREALERGTNLSEIQYKCKVAARFSGSMRKNITTMLDEIKLHKALGLASTSELFEARDDLLHTVSLIPYPVFYKKQNYTGHTPKLLKSEFLMRIVVENFKCEKEKLEHFDELLLIPLGKAVEDVLDFLAQHEVIKESQILKGFPHPSGANGRRLTQLSENKEQLIMQIKHKVCGEVRCLKSK